ELEVFEIRQSGQIGDAVIVDPWASADIEQAKLLERLEVDHPGARQWRAHQQQLLDVRQVLNGGQGLVGEFAAEAQIEILDAGQVLELSKSLAGDAAAFEAQVP